MKQKKGFIATSLIYSFFLVFLMLMTTILVRSTNNRILLGALKEDIINSLNEDEGFVVDKLKKDNTYTLGEDISFAGESWKIIANTTNSVTLVLARSLTKPEVENAIGRTCSETAFSDPECSNEWWKNEKEEKCGSKQYYKNCSNLNCNDSGCRIRACRNSVSGQLYCYLYSPNTLIHTKPAWNPTETAITDDDYGQTIVSGVVQNWFQLHQGLQRAKDKGSLKLMNFNDGHFNTTGYIRIPRSNEYANAGGPTPYHILDKATGVHSELQVKIYNGSAIEQVSSVEDAFIRPVIEVNKE